MKKYKVDAYVDSMSAFSIVQLFSHPDPEECFNWVFQPATGLTSALIFSDNLKLSPEVSIPKDPKSGMKKYSEFFPRMLPISFPELSKAQTTDALNKTRNWVGENADFLSNAYYGNLLKNSDNEFTKWLNWNVTNGQWILHAERFGSLIEAEFIEEIGKVSINRETKRIKELFEFTSIKENILELVKVTDKHELFNEIRDAHVFTLLIRGIYYANIASSLNVQWLHHPLRSVLFDNENTKNQIEFKPTLWQNYLSNIIIASAFRYKDKEERLEEWKNNIEEVTKNINPNSDNINDDDDDDDKQALEKAIKIAKKSNIQFNTAQLETVLNIANVLGSAATGFIFNPWVAGIITVVAGAVTYTGNLGQQICRLTTTNNKLRTIALAGPGRIKRTWAGVKSTDNKP